MAAGWPSTSKPRPCREACGIDVILARRDVTGRWMALEARASGQVPGAFVVINGAAWQPGDLVTHFMTRFEISEPKARAHVNDYPHHLPHHHESRTTPSNTDTEKENP